MQENRYLAEGPGIVVHYSPMSILKRLFHPLQGGTARGSGEDLHTRSGLFLPADRRIGSCMTHRPDIQWIDASSSPEAIRATLNSFPGYTQFPVCSGSVDRVLGVLSVRSFLEALQEPAWPGLKSIVKKAVFLPETATILRALETLAASECRLAFIIDEYGGVEGMVTRNGLMAELLEELGGTEEGEEEKAEQREDGSRLMDGLTRMEDVRELFGLEETESDSGEYYTLAGYLLSLNGSIPRPGDVIPAGDYRCEIVEMDGNRIEKVRVSPAAEGRNG